VTDERALRRLRQRRRRQRRRIATVAILGAGAAAAIAVAVVGSHGGGRHASGGRHPSGALTTAAVRPGRVPARPRAARLRLPTPLPLRTLTVPILMYHRIDRLTPSLPSITRRLTVAPADFAQQMEWLHVNRFHTLTQRQLFDALERGRPLPPRPVVITFDDGYRDVFRNAVPVLHRLRLTATLYVITSRISGPDPSFLSWGEVEGLDRLGFDVGSHTEHHLELPGLSDSAAAAELVGSRRALERRLHHPVQWFAYPAGAFDTRSVDLVRRAGYVVAVTTRPGAEQRAQAPLELRRYEILDTTGVAGVASLLGLR
jgi:peptidoglycan/xylan/chitin deacetylase (PgdA/CDA1 family)